MKNIHKYIILCIGLLYMSASVSATNYVFVQESDDDSSQCYKIAVCDWMILKRQKIGAFQLAKELGSDGLELDMGSLGRRDSFDNKLREEHFQKLFKAKAAEFDIQISSIAMSGFYGQSFLSRSDYQALVQDCLNTMKVMNVPIAFLPLGTGCDLQKNPGIRPELVQRLKIVGDMAVEMGKVIGIETSLNAREEVRLLNEINSPGIKIYFKFQNPLENGRDLCRELRILGKERICQIHCTDTDGVTLPYNERLDMQKVKTVLDEMGWCGWLVVERSRNKEDIRNVTKNFSENIDYLKNIFQK